MSQSTLLIRPVEDIPAHVAFGPYPVEEALRTPILNAPTTCVEDLTAWLAEWDLPLSEWGQGQAKSPTALLKELREGACRLFLLDPHGPDQRVCRFSLGSTVTIGYQSPEGETLMLIEDRQEFTDGRPDAVKYRGLSQVGEKAEPGETPLQTAQRALTEELSLPVFDLTHVDQREVYGDSLSYPGIVSWYVFDRFVGIMPDELYVAEGYVEEQSDKRSIFLWKPVA